MAEEQEVVLTEEMGKKNNEVKTKSLLGALILKGLKDKDEKVPSGIGIFDDKHEDYLKEIRSDYRKIQETVLASIVSSLSSSSRIFLMSSSLVSKAQIWVRLTISLTSGNF